MGGRRSRSKNEPEWLDMMCDDTGGKKAISCQGKEEKEGIKDIPATSKCEGNPVLHTIMHPPEEPVPLS